MVELVFAVQYIKLCCVCVCEKLMRGVCGIINEESKNIKLWRVGNHIKMYLISLNFTSTLYLLYIYMDKASTRK